ncbi:MAG: PorV/PorQ family protein [Elusimicrobiales bacterium]|nr:PorV/PorQ family protein [Elusimicrobiales bacterium]
MKEERPGRRYMTAWLLALALLAPAPPAGAAKIYPSAGTTSAAFLKIGVGARPVAMAGAYTAVADDPYAVYWNPAGLAVPYGRAAVFTHNEYFEGLAQEYAGYLLPGEDIGFLKNSRFSDGAMGFGLNYFYTPRDLERRSGLNEADPLNPISPVEGKFRAYDLAFSAAYGFNYSRDLRLGAGLKFIRQSIDSDSGNTAALDLGALYDFHWLDRQFTAGFTVQNLGPGIKFNDKRFGLPLVFKAGLAHRVYENGLLVALDVSKPVDNYPSVALGLEQPLSGRLFLRTGYRYRQHGNELGAFSGFGAGLGFVYNQFSFDYAFSPFGDLGTAHRLSLAYRFKVQERPAARRPSEAVPAVERLEGARRVEYSVVRKPVKISPRGVDYSVEAVSAEAGLGRVAFKSRQRGGAEGPALEVLEGSLPQVLAVKLPAGYTQLSAWEFGGGFWGVTGELELLIRFREGAAAGKKAEFFYLTSSGWRKAASGGAACSEGGCSVAAKVPLSTHYVLAVKE